MFGRINAGQEHGGLRMFCDNYSPGKFEILQFFTICSARALILGLVLGGAFVEYGRFGSFRKWCFGGLGGFVVCGAFSFEKVQKIV